MDDIPCVNCGHLATGGVCIGCGRDFCDNCLNANARCATCWRALYLRSVKQVG
jgi:hypothetical protein